MIIFIGTYEKGKYMNNSLIIKIKRICIEVEKLSNSLLQTYDLTHTQFSILKYLYENNSASIRQIDIEKHFSLTNPTVTGILQNLEKKNLIIRIQNPDDSRSKIIKLASKSQDIKECLVEYGDKLENLVTKKLTSEEKMQLNDLLDKLRI